jgi:CubicO group peptidase (beta-lactamase class C family)
VSKQFTASAIMLLAADGKLSLDDDIRKHLPEIPDYGHPITIRHLLTHTSGLRDQWDLLIMARGGRFEEDRITEADVLEIVARQKGLNFVPGTEYLYSNTGYTLAGTIVRRVSGKSLRAFADERIFRPLGMTNTHFHDDYTMIVPGRAAGYARNPGGWRVSLPNYDTYGATSLFSTVGDLLKWEANFARPMVGTAAIFQQMATSAVLLNGDSTAYGLGLSVGPLSRRAGGQPRRRRRRIPDLGGQIAGPGARRRRAVQCGHRGPGPARVRHARRAARGQARRRPATGPRGDQPHRRAAGALCRGIRASAHRPAAVRDPQARYPSFLVASTDRGSSR